jgi:methionyl-tRNA formyltransferase
VRVVFLGSPPFATPILARLLASPWRPSLVLTPPGRARGRGRQADESELAALARAAGEGVELLEAETLRSGPALARLCAAEADVFLVASYGELLRQEVLDLPRHACLNVHPSLLPRHRGATPVQAAILAGDQETGTTIQRVVLALDAGDVLVQRRTPILPGETAGELSARLAELSAEAASEALELVARGAARYQPQDPAGVTVCKRLSKEDGRIDWARPALELERHVRAMNPWPLAATALPGGAPLLVHRASLAPGDPRAAPGTLLEAGARLVVATGEGALELTEVQAAGKRALPAAEFQRGARLAPGQRLGA